MLHINRIVKCIVIIASFPINSWAEEISGCSSNGECYAYSYYSLVSYMDMEYIHDISIDGCQGVVGAFSPRGKYFTATFPFKVWKWSAKYSSWNQHQQFVTSYLDAPPAQVEAVFSFIASHGIPMGAEPSQYWPNGPPENCGDPCVEEKQAKIAECGEAGLNEATWDDQTCSGQCTLKKENGYGPSCESGECCQ